MMRRGAVMTVDEMGRTWSHFKKNGRLQGRCPYRDDSKPYDIMFSDDHERFYCSICQASGLTPAGVRKHGLSDSARPDFCPYKPK